ncbi:MAG: hypothetical protein A2X25_09365 [Chloroflexi bacterium GWB2_49_20]|nr:MAG: hypothetical protein A2X25_09365 [Chloroflexi bacterium GWB2_49_20]OGN79365.1 MAG: hypothetical protein A2X26_04660 [Chloroflexi bacterium GWC2_49_37]OGN82865.1 MAG: hypothetical protein A2X27_08035 [Chloroflexi bacterium GWD2_49_16]HCM97341.1 hypothetical protein [Anaerolineae bacterium]
MDKKYIQTVLTILTIILRDKYSSFLHFNLFPTIFIANLTNKSNMLIMFRDWVEKIKNKNSNSTPFLLGFNFYFY